MATTPFSSQGENGPITSNAPNSISFQPPSQSLSSSSSSPSFAKPTSPGKSKAIQRRIIRKRKNPFQWPPEGGGGVREWLQGVSSVVVAAGWGEVGSAVPDAKYFQVLRSQMRMLLKQLPLLERAGIGALAGGLAGGFTNAALHPIDTVKTKLQMKGSSAIYSGPLDVIRKVSGSQGMSGFYSGLPAAILGSIASSAIYFGTYELCKGALSHELSVPASFTRVPSRLSQVLRLQGSRTSTSSSPSLSPSSSTSLGSSEGPSFGGEAPAITAGKVERGVVERRALGSREGRWVQVALPPVLVPPVAAALGNVASSAILVPKEVIKQRMQAGAQGTALQVLQRTLATEGVAGLYAGYAAALLRNVPTNVLNFSVFEYMKAAFLASTGSAVLQPWQSMLSGAVAGATSSALTTPLDVVKTRLMTQARSAVMAGGATGAKAESAAKAKALASYTYGGVSSTLRTVLREEGARGLMRGMAPRVLYSTCFSAIGFFSYETARLFLLGVHLERKRREEEERHYREEQTNGDAAVTQ